MHALVGTIATVYALHNEVCYISGVKGCHAYLLHVSTTAVDAKVKALHGKVTLAG